MYNYGARYYDPSIGIFLSVDPLADQFPSHSPYNYTLNNPINMIDPDGRAPVGVGDPPKRGVGLNAPYLYSRTSRTMSGTMGLYRSHNYSYNPDKNYSHLNSMFFHESNIPNRFIAHYQHGGGSQYNLNTAEFKELAMSRPNLRNSKQFQGAGNGSTTGEFIVPSTFTRQDGTVGEASFLYNGTLNKGGDGTFSFEGTMSLVDRYDFNWRDKERSPSNKFLTWWGAVSMNGDDFKIVGPQINITETQNSHSHYPAWKGVGQGGKSEENGGKEF